MREVMVFKFYRTFFNGCIPRRSELGTKGEDFILSIAAQIALTCMAHHCPLSAGKF